MVVLKRDFNKYFNIIFSINICTSNKVKLEEKQPLLDLISQKCDHFFKKRFKGNNLLKQNCLLLDFNLLHSVLVL